MDWMTIIGICLLIFAAYCAVRFHYYGTIVGYGEKAVTLRNGDRISCSTTVRIEGDIAYCLSLVIPRVPPQEGVIRNEASALVAGVINRWALQFASASDARAREAYDSLERALNAGIRSPNFAAASAEVTCIEVVSHGPKSEDPEAEPPELTPVEAVRKKHTVVIEEIEAIQQSEADIASKHASVTADPDVQEELRNMFGADKREAIFRDAPLGYRRNIDRKKRRG